MYLKLATKDRQNLHICLESVNWEFLIFMCSFWCWKQEKFVLLIAKPKSILCSETSTWKAFSGNDVSVPQGSVCQRFWKPIKSERSPPTPPHPSMDGSRLSTMTKQENLQRKQLHAGADLAISSQPESISTSRPSRNAQRMIVQGT